MTKIGEAYVSSREKRTFDLIGATLLVTATAPLAGATALALSIEQRNIRPVFRQQRIGREAVPFNLLKFLTFTSQDDSNFCDTNGPNDPRASQMAKLIRRSGLDELPQLVNVLAGQISLVGIRPQVETVLEQRQSADPRLFADWYFCYQQNLGIFGAGQTYAHEIGYYKENSDTIREVMRLDVAAFQEASLANDARIIAAQPIGLLRSMLAAPQAV